MEKINPVEAAKNYLEYASTRSMLEVIEEHFIGTTDEGIPVVYYPDMAHMYNMVCLGIIRFPTVFGEPSYIIATDDIYKNMPSDSQRWMVFHELGHYHHKDLEGISVGAAALKAVKRSLLNTVGLVPQCEVLADRYATEHTSVGVGVKALTEFYELLDDDQFKSTRREIKSRIRKLKRLA